MLKKRQKKTTEDDERKVFSNSRAKYEQYMRLQKELDLGKTLHYYQMLLSPEKPIWGSLPFTVQTELFSRFNVISENNELVYQKFILVAFPFSSTNQIHSLLLTYPSAVGESITKIWLGSGKQQGDTVLTVVEPTQSTWESYFDESCLAASVSSVYYMGQVEKEQGDIEAATITNFDLKTLIDMANISMNATPEKAKTDTDNLFSWVHDQLDYGIDRIRVRPAYGARQCYIPREHYDLEFFKTVKIPNAVNEKAMPRSLKAISGVPQINLQGQKGAITQDFFQTDVTFYNSSGDKFPSVVKLPSKVYAQVYVGHSVGSRAIEAPFYIETRSKFVGQPNDSIRSLVEVYTAKGTNNATETLEKLSYITDQIPIRCHNRTDVLSVTENNLEDRLFRILL